jgi:hypothetical protein
LREKPITWDEFAEKQKERAREEEERALQVRE